jgi:DNA (cytosine-5)-methyltransferase 1
MQNKKAYITISEAAVLVKKSVDTIRRWERQGYVVSQRNPGNNYRIFDIEQLETLQNLARGIKPGVKKNVK